MTLYFSVQMVVHIFLFTDVLLVTKPIKKGADRYAVVRPVRGHHNKKSQTDTNCLMDTLYHLSTAALQDCFSCTQSS